MVARWARCAVVGALGCCALVSGLSGSPGAGVSTARRCRGPSPLQAAGDWAEARAAQALAAKKRVVMKFGGSSVANAERIAHVAALIADRMKEGAVPTVVLSAMGKTTNNLVSAGQLAFEEGRVRVDELRALHLETLDELALPASCGYEVRQLLRELEQLLDGVSMVKELSPRTKDLVVSYGERMSCRILAAQLVEAHGIKAVPCESWKIGLRTTGGFGEGVVDEACYPDMAKALRSLVVDQEAVPIVTGYIGHDAEGRVTTLGRGGSDLTATVLGACFYGEPEIHFYSEVQVWKDVDGMMSADPRIIPEAVPVPYVTYEEAQELAYFGAQVLHPISMLPALKAGVPVRVKNSYNPQHPGTLIADAPTIDAARKAEATDAPLLTALTSKRGVTLVDVTSTRMLGQSGFLSSIFKVFEDDGVSVDVVATSEVSVSLTLEKKGGDLSRDGKAKLEEIAYVDVKRNRAIVSFIADVSRSTELIAKVFTVLSDNSISVEMLSQGASKVNISLVIADDDAERALSLIHQCFFKDKCTVLKPLQPSR